MLILAYDGFVRRHIHHSASDLFFGKLGADLAVDSKPESKNPVRSNGKHYIAVIEL